MCPLYFFTSPWLPPDLASEPVGVPHLGVASPLFFCLIFLDSMVFCPAAIVNTADCVVQTAEMYHSSRDWESKVKVPSGLVPGKAALPGLWMATFSQCPNRLPPVCAGGKGEVSGVSSFSC